MRLAVLAAAILLTGCSTAIPIKPKFPEPPGQLVRQSCPQLQQLQPDAKLSDVAKTVTVNYSTYYECAVKVDAWNQWYGEQRALHEGLK